MTKLAIGIDLHRCIGCNTCAGLQDAEQRADGMLWNRVLTEGCDRFDSAEESIRTSRAPICRWRASIARTRRAACVPHGRHL